MKSVSKPLRAAVLDAGDEHPVVAVHLGDLVDVVALLARLATGAAAAFHGEAADERGAAHRLLELLVQRVDRLRHQQQQAEHHMCHLRLQSRRAALKGRLESAPARAAVKAVP